MNNLTVVCLTKSYRLDDFICWFNHYKKLGCNIVIYDNESTVDIKSYVIENGGTYNKINGWPNQWVLFDKILNNNTLNLDIDDFITFLDDDEYLWYDKLTYASINESIRHYFKQLDSLLVPEILMSSKHLLTTRKGTVIDELYYRRSDYSSQGKAIIRYNPGTKYKFNHNSFERGHVPKINTIRMSEVVSDVPGNNISKTTYGVTGYECGLRLYHYHIKSKQDWEIKINRGSAATKNDGVKNGSYDEDIRKNKKFGNYEVPDFALKNF